MCVFRFILSASALVWCCAPVSMAQSDSNKTGVSGAGEDRRSGCIEDPQEDALVSMCAPSSAEEAPDPPIPTAMISLAIPQGMPLRIALDGRVRVNHAGEPVRGKVVEAVYAFDQPVIPAGSTVTGRVAKIDGVPKVRRILAYSNGDLTPFHKYEVTFDTLILPDGKHIPIQTTVSAGTAEVVHLVSGANKQQEEQKGTAAKATDRAKKEAKGRIQDAKNQVHQGWAMLKAPGKMHRIKQLLVAQLPYRRQYIDSGTRFVADLNQPLSFGDITRTAPQLATIGGEPAPDSTLKARLAEGVSSATAKRGTPVTAILTEPLYSPRHDLILPADTRLVGQVLQAKPAGKLHHNGELRVIFERIETPEEATRAAEQIKQQEEAQAEAEARARATAEQARPIVLQRRSQAMNGNLEGVEVDRAANLKLDEEGGARATDSKSRYLSTGLAILVAAAASHPDAERGQVDAAGDPTVRAASGASGSRLTGALLSFVAKSLPVSIAFGVYGASSSIYANFLSRGHEVVLPKDTPVEIGFGTPHPGQSGKD